MPLCGGEHGGNALRRNSPGLGYSHNGLSLCSFQFHNIQSAAASRPSSPLPLIIQRACPSADAIAVLGYCWQESCRLIAVGSELSATLIYLWARRTSFAITPIS